MATETIILPAGTYSLSGGGTRDVLTLTASITQTTPAVGNTLTLTTNATSGTATYQWKKNSVDVDVTTATYNSTGDAADDVITCAVTSGTQTVTTAGVTLTVASEYPATDTAAVFWLDASDAGSIVASGNDLTTIEDKVSGTVLFTPNGNVDTGLATLNSLNVLSMVGGRLDSPETDLTGNLALHMVCDIGTVNNLSDSLFLFRSSDSTSTSTGSLWRLQSNNGSAFNGRSNIRDSGGGSRNLSMSGGPFSGVSLVSFVWNVATDTISMFVNDVAAGSETNFNYSEGMTATSSLRVFGDYSQNLEGTLAEMIVTADITNRAAYTTYLADKWGIVL